MHTPPVLQMVLAAGVLPAVALAQAIVLPPAPAGVSTFTLEGIQFSAVQASNVQPYMPPNGQLNRPVGAGSWNFGIARTELTQGQWVEFLRAFNDVPIPQNQPYTSGLQTILSGTFGAGPGMYFEQFDSQGRGYWQVTPEMVNRPVWQIGWFGGALYCNWLSSGRQTSIAALTTGSYDLTQFDVDQPGSWPTITRAANAQFFIPTYDEWAVASYYDPNRNGPGAPGWWTYLNRQDRPSIPGPPGEGETSYLWDAAASGFPSMYDLLLPAASYPNSQSPWGLFDTSGSRHEALDDVSRYTRMFAGTQSGPLGFPELEAYQELMGWYGSATPLGEVVGVRIATAVPSPAVAAILFCLMTARCPQRRRR